MSFIEYQFCLFQNNCATLPSFYLQSVGVLHLHPDVHGGAAGVPGEGGQGQDLLTSKGVSTDGAHGQHLPHPRRGRGALHHRLPSLLQGDGSTHTCCCIIINHPCYHYLRWLISSMPSSSTSSPYWCSPFSTIYQNSLNWQWWRWITLQSTKGKYVHLLHVVSLWT